MSKSLYFEPACLNPAAENKLPIKPTSDTKAPTSLKVITRGRSPLSIGQPRRDLKSSRLVHMCCSSCSKINNLLTVGQTFTCSLSYQPISSGAEDLRLQIGRLHIYWGSWLCHGGPGRGGRSPTGVLPNYIIAWWQNQPGRSHWLTYTVRTPSDVNMNSPSGGRFQIPPWQIGMVQELFMSQD